MLSFRKTYLALSWPLISQSVLHILMQHIDLMMIGQIGTPSVAAIGLVNAFFFVFFMFFIALGFGVFTLMTQLYGDKNLVALVRLTGSAVLVSFVAGILFWLIFLQSLNFFLVLWNVEADVIHRAQSYAEGLGPGLSFLAGIIILESCLRSFGFIRQELHIKILGIIINSLLNLVFIFGLWDFPAMGELGAGLATSLTRFIMFLMFFYLFVMKIKPVEMHWRQIFSFESKLWYKVFQFSSILIMQDIFWSAAILAYSRAFSEMGTDILAVYNVVYLMDRFADSFCTGFSIAAGIQVGRDLGQNKFQRAWIRSRLIIRICIMQSFRIILFIFLLSPIVLMFYPFSNDQQHLYWSMFFIHLLIYPVKMMGMIILVGVLRSGGDYFKTAVIELGGMYFYSVPCVLLSALYLRWNAVAVFAILSSEWILKSVLVYRRYTKKIWLKRLL